MIIATSIAEDWASASRTAVGVSSNVTSRLFYLSSHFTYLERKCLGPLFGGRAARGSCHSPQEPLVPSGGPAQRTFSNAPSIERALVVQSPSGRLCSVVFPTTFNGVLPPPTLPFIRKSRAPHSWRLMRTSVYVSALLARLGSVASLRLTIDSLPLWY